MIWIKFALFIMIVFVFISLVKLLLRKVFNIEKENKFFFSYNHLNGLHRKIDWAVRTTSLIIFIVIYSLVMFKGHSINLILIVFTFWTLLDYAVSAFFERKYSKNPKQYILTISEGSILVIALIVVMQFDLLVNLSS